MEAPNTEHEMIKGYLLGQIPKEDESQVEARLLTDREFYEELSIVENEVIDQYLTGGLSTSDRQSFESHFISSSERQQKVRFARALRKCVSVAGNQDKENLVAHETALDLSDIARLDSSTQSSLISVFSFKKPLISYAVAAAIFIVVGGGSWLLLKYWRAESTGGRLLAVELTPAPATRGSSDVKQIDLMPDIESLRLQLDLPKNEYQSYEAILRDSSLRDVMTTKHLKAQLTNGVAFVIMDVKANVLFAGDYRIHLSGTMADGRSESVVTFSFTIRTK